ncbi:MAG TPA: pyridoxamine 5'-phosphate oxidase family protein [Myxococcota bacterium]|nr:pyridoxamine 5'-phosphate oxidase family protein [Myxococcota bacterium]
MGKVYDQIDERLAAWIGAQRIFFVATAPLAAGGLVNCSPRGLEGLALLGPREVAWLDLTGSGVETIAHLRENGRIALLFCAFEGPPRIVRLQGRGTVVEPGDPEFAALRGRFDEHEGVRAVIRVECTRISDSCGYGVPRMDYQGDRDQLAAWARRKGPDGLRAYRAKNNARSVEGLPGLRASAAWMSDGST